ncbi:heparan-alpha-glucosaminide N-acetyltransferase domain-containing protein [Lutimonas vermicola]|uniref:Heparan-alpha-glucosaminide N-acetyltransferase domain-containing protein n=1 Tax=Lutimonas vermicola TaxID=414288 RepID=A0ABU9L1S9_9FLAO
MRLASIDILRALTMVFMIWVNDFWTLIDIPKWLTHASATEDYMGFSDVIFPLFLFIVGLSIPLAIQNRLDKKDSPAAIAKHILIRSVSLLVIGLYMVNYETAHTSMILSKSVWCLLMATAVVLIWTNWKRSPVDQKWHFYLQASGYLILAFLAFIYKGGEHGELWMTTQWWGILGLIGWAYLLNALVYLYAKGNLWVMVILWMVLNGLAVLAHSAFTPKLDGPLVYLSPVLTGTIPAFTTAGIVATLLFKKLRYKDLKWFYATLLGLGLINLIYGLATRPIWGISKIQGTPSWLAICTGIGFILFAVLYYIADQKKVTGWAKIIAPAGTATLTCYMIPYFIYPMRSFSGFRFPDLLNTAVLGLLLSFAFALLVVIFTGWLEKKGYKLKL